MTSNICMNIEQASPQVRDGIATCPACSQHHLNVWSLVDNIYRGVINDANKVLMGKIGVCLARDNLAFLERILNIAN